jgi:hypothetical protein
MAMNLPGVQTPVQDVWLALPWYLPAGQIWHEDAPFLALNLPAGQFPHAIDEVEPAVAMNLPGVQSPEHDVWPALLVNWPDGQLLQIAGQDACRNFMQLVCCAGPYLPAGHLMHPLL